MTAAHRALRRALSAALWLAALACALALPPLIAAWLHALRLLPGVTH